MAPQKGREGGGASDIYGLSIPKCDPYQLEYTLLGGKRTKMTETRLMETTSNLSK